MKLLEGKVAVITGAGGGLGRCHALALAEQGCKVVVNDVGGSRDGSGAGTRMADLVVEEIQKAGGEAVVNYDSVATTEGAEGIIQTAVKAFGRIDILVNNAGILRDKTILKMADEEWDPVIAVHLRGTWACTRAAARVMKDQETGGHIVNTTSIAGLKGNFGQANYGAAKAGIYALTRIAALELGKHGIAVNAIAPIAKTRMTEDIESVSEDLRPEDVSPFAVFLASENTKEITGRVFGVHGKHLFEYNMEMTEGVKKETPWTAVEIAERFPEVERKAAPVAAAPAPAPAPAGGLTVATLFQALPTGFEPDKAQGFDAAYHFEVAGAGDWSVEVKDGACKISQGVPAAPTCKVTTDQETLLGMAEGKIDGNAAFMKGKIKASRIDQLAKFGKVFNFKKMKAAAPAAVAASSAAPAGGFTIAMLFQALPTGFEPDKAQGFDATYHFEVAGAGDWLVEVKNAACRIAEGKPDAPTCKVATDQETLLGMAEGKIDGNAAFMKGKIKASRIDQLAKFGKVFNFKKMKAAAPAAVAAPAKAKVGVSPETALAGIAHRFLPEKAAGFNAVLQFEVDGKQAAVVIQDQTCTVTPGAHASPTGKVTVDAATLAGILNGESDAQKAFGEGRVKITHPPSWLKFKQCFRFEPDRGLNRALVGKVYASKAVLLRPERIQAYDEAVGDTGSLVFPVSLIKDLVVKLIEDPDFNGDVARMVHGEQVFRYFDTLRPWDLVSPRAQVLSVEDKSSGQILNVAQRLYREGRLVVEMETRLFFRGESKGEKAKPAAEEPDRGAPTGTDVLAVAEDLPYRYAKASGDDNPIHVDPEFARSVGFRGVILQGLCTLAMAARSLPKELREFSARFSKPVYPGDTLTTSVWRKGDSFEFETATQNGDKVLVNGRASLS